MIWITEIKGFMQIYGQDIFSIITQRLRLYAVRVCGLLLCPQAPKFEQGRMLEICIYHEPNLIQ